MSNTEIFRSRASLVYAGWCAAFCALFLWSETYSGSAKSIWSSGFVVAAILTTVHLLLIKPKIILGDEGLIIINPLRRYSISWSDVQDFETRWALTVTTKDFSAVAWCAPASGKPMRNIQRSDIRGAQIEAGDESVRLSDLPQRDSGAAALRVRNRYIGYRRAQNASFMVTTRTRDYRGILAIAVLMLVALLVQHL
jgi:hypothetical protein